MWILIDSFYVLLLVGYKIVVDYIILYYYYKLLSFLLMYYEKFCGEKISDRNDWCFLERILKLGEVNSGEGSTLILSLHHSTVFGLD